LEVPKEAAPVKEAAPLKEAKPPKDGVYVIPQR
jgi:hypothetical protein